MLHICDASLSSWKRADLEAGNEDAHMSCTEQARTALMRSISSWRSFQQAKRWLRRAVGMADEPEAIAACREANEFLRPHVHVIQCDRDGPHILNLSNWLERAKAFGALPKSAGWNDTPDWTAAKNWLDRCEIDEADLWYTIKWGDRLAEVLLLRDMLRDDHFSAGTVLLSDVDACLLQRCQNSYRGGWCRRCLEALERDARDQLLKLARRQVHIA